MNAARMNLLDLQCALLDLVAPPGWRDMGITSATLELTAKQYPRLTLQIEKIPTDPADFDTASAQLLQQRFELVPLDDAPAEPSLDLDRVTQEVQARLHRAVHKSAEAHLFYYSDDARERQAAAEARHQEAIHAHRAEVLRRTLQPWVKLTVSALAEQFSKGGMHGGPSGALLSAGMYGAAGALFAASQGYIDPVKEPAPSTFRALGRRLTRALRLPCLATVAAAAVIAVALGWLGPALDAQPDRRAEWLQAEQELQATGALQQWEAEARLRCAALTGDNGTYVQVDGGGIVCTDKRGRTAGKGTL